MKKLLKTIIIFVLALSTCFGLVACGDGAGSWQGASLKEWGNAKTQGSFIAQTDNYVYFINGQANYTNDNSYGTPVKGSLMVIKKTDLASGDISKAEIAVPKIFGATDYSAGLYIYGDYVYYGTPNVNRNSSGSVANTEMTIAKTKLDGTEHSEIITLPALSEQYRIVKGANGVEVLYYDAEKTAIISYNVETKTSTEIAKTDISANESLTEYKFLPVEEGKPVLVYATQVYSEKYYEDKAEEEGYTRESSHGKIYTYTAGEQAVKVVDGQVQTGHGKSYVLTYLASDILFYTESTHEEEKVYGSKIADLADLTKRKEINDSSLLTKTTIIKSLEEAYIVSTDLSTVEKTILYGNQQTVRQTVIKTADLSSAIDVVDGYFYYYDTNKVIMRMELSNQDAKAQKVSSDSAASTWYAPNFLTLNEKTYLVYLDSSTVGSNYLSAINLTDATIEEKTEGDLTTYQLTGNFSLSKMLAEDEAKKAIQALNTAVESTELKYEITDTGIVFEKYEQLVKVYNELSQGAKDALSDDFNTKFQNVKKAVAVAEYYVKLDGIRHYNDKQEVPTELKTAYEQAKTKTLSYTEEEFAEFRVYIPNNLKYEYQQATKIFEDK